MKKIILFVIVTIISFVVVKVIKNKIATKVAEEPTGI